MKVLAQCWVCGKTHEIKNLHPNRTDVNCTCGGPVITPSGKAKMTIISNRLYRKWYGSAWK